MNSEHAEMLHQETPQWYVVHHNCNNNSSLLLADTRPQHACMHPAACTPRPITHVRAPSDDVSQAWSSEVTVHGAPTHFPPLSAMPLPLHAPMSATALSASFLESPSVETILALSSFTLLASVVLMRLHARVYEPKKIRTLFQEIVDALTLTLL